MSRVPFVAEIDDADAAWLRGCGRGLPEGVELRAVDEVLFMGRVYEESASGLLLPQTEDPLRRIEREAREHARKLTGLDLFAGCGGFSLGCEMAGIDMVAAVEWDVTAATTYLWNLGHPDCRIAFDGPATEAKWRKALGKGKLREPWIGSGAPSARTSAGGTGGCRGFYVGDITRTTGRALLDLAGVERVNVVVGGPPCQGLSRANAKACIKDPRNALLWEFLRIVEESQPDSFIIENVPGLLTAGRGGLIEALAAKAVNAGYEVRATLLNATHYGVPQHRVRAIVIGSRTGARLTYPMPTHWSRGWTRDGERWHTGEPGDRWDHRGEAPAPAVAAFDPAMRTWAAPGEPESVEPASAPNTGQQPDLFGTEAA